mmetsp:Transcript_99638/g.228652  ORF Transcript_99638/g.228652 Transcript_99638/m.228652 type:complete len:251 (-) Transcript_99638:2094-2846(-)
MHARAHNDIVFSSHVTHAGSIPHGRVVQAPSVRPQGSPCEHVAQHHHAATLKFQVSGSAGSRPRRDSAGGELWADWQRECPAPDPTHGFKRPSDHPVVRHAVVTLQQGLVPFKLLIQPDPGQLHSRRRPTLTKKSQLLQVVMQPIPLKSFTIERVVQQAGGDKAWICYSNRSPNTQDEPEPLRRPDAVADRQQETAYNPTAVIQNIMQRGCQSHLGTETQLPLLAFPAENLRSDRRVPAMVGVQNTTGVR